MRGVIAPAVTPFGVDGKIDFKNAILQFEWLLNEGVHGLVVGGSTGEGHTITAPEFDPLIDTAVSVVQGRIPVIAAIISNSTHEAVIKGQVAAKYNVSALQVSPVHYLFHPSENAMVDYYRTIASETGQKIIIYNDLPWAYLSSNLLLHIMEEVPQVIGVKQSSGDMKLFADLIATAPEEKLIYCAADALMHTSYTLGAHGSIAAIVAAAPRASVDLWDLVAQNNHAMARILHEKLLFLWNTLLPHNNLPAAVKAAQALQGVDSGIPRAPIEAVDESQMIRILKALEELYGVIENNSPHNVQ